MGVLIFTAVFIVAISWHQAATSSLKCPANSHNGMVSGCVETCDTKLFGLKDCLHSRVERCICNEGLIAQSGTSGESVVCVKSDKCEAKCGPNMHYEKKATGCPATCKHPKGHKICLEPHHSKCVCNVGYVLNHEKDKTCVKESECKK